ncbi:MAG: nucleoside recognition protein, partial [Ignavibacteriaceae bacterium]|nr:nucleoside recognition protein [Ignavibacteriaceae bacterium]
MLNYVWLTLLFLGIVSATYLDISDFTSNKYNNSKPLNALIYFEDSEVSDSEKETAIIKITANRLSTFYAAEISNDIETKIILSPADEDGKRQFVINVSDQSPKIWKEIAPLAGKDNDIGGTIILNKKTENNIIYAQLYFEEISFVWLKKVTNDAIKIAQVAVEIALGLIGIMALWLGVMRVAEDAG